jgi:Ca2+-binding EF-hand superfamily protein
MAVSNITQVRLTDLQKQKLMRLFAMYDANNTGTLTLYDFQNLVDRLATFKGFRKDSSEYIQLMDRLMHRWIHLRSEVKESMSGQFRQYVTLDEWLAYFEKVLQEESYRDHIREVANLIFDAVDADKSSSLDLEEWRHLFQAYNIPVIYAAEAFSRIDQDHDGYLSKAELLALIEEFYYSQDPESPGNFMFGPC